MIVKVVLPVVVVLMIYFDDDSNGDDDHDSGDVHDVIVVYIKQQIRTTENIIMVTQRDNLFCQIRKTMPADIAGAAPPHCGMKIVTTMRNLSSPRDMGRDRRSIASSVIATPS